MQGIENQDQFTLVPDSELQNLAEEHEKVPVSAQGIKNSPS